MRTRRVLMVLKRLWKHNHLLKSSSSFGAPAQGRLCLHPACSNEMSHEEQWVNTALKRGRWTGLGDCALWLCHPFVRGPVSAFCNLLFPCLWGQLGKPHQSGRSTRIHSPLNSAEVLLVLAGCLGQFWEPSMNIC